MQAEYIFGAEGFYEFEKCPKQRELIGPLLGRGIFVSDGHEWMRQRKTASRMFSTRRMRDYMFKVFDRSSSELVEKVRELTAGGEPIDMFNMFNRLTLDAFTESAFGYDMKCVSSAPKEVPFMHALDYTQAILIARFLVSDLWRVFRFFGVMWEKLLPDFLKTINELVTSVIEQRLKVRRECGTQSAFDGGDFLTLFLDDENLEDDERSMESLRDVILNFILAGRDTTAQTLSWMTYELALNPDVVAKAREEVESADKLDFQTVSKGLPYLEAVMNETLRRHSVVPSAAKYALKDTSIPCPNCDPIRVSKGDMVVLHSYSLNKNPDVWEDPLSFKPERFLGTKQDSTHQPYKHFVFNAGDRTCLGRTFAYLEVKMCAARMLRNFEFRLVDADSIDFIFAFTLPFRNGLYVTAKDRLADDEDLIKHTQVL